MGGLEDIVRMLVGNPKRELVLNETERKRRAFWMDGRLKSVLKNLWSERGVGLRQRERHFAGNGTDVDERENRFWEADCYFIGDMNHSIEFNDVGTHIGTLPRQPLIVIHIY